QELGRGLPEATPYEEVRDFFHFVDNYVHDLDIAAEGLALELGEGAGQGGAMGAFLERKFGVRLVAVPSANALRHFDPVTRVLSLNADAPAETRIFQIAVQLAQLHAGDLIDSIARSAGFRSEQAAEICRIGLHHYFAGALLMPYQSFLRTAR